MCGQFSTVVLIVRRPISRQVLCVRPRVVHLAASRARMKISCLTSAICISNVSTVELAAVCFSE